MAAALSQDLRDQVIAAIEGGSCRQAPERFKRRTGKRKRSDQPMNRSNGGIPRITVSR